MMKNSLSKNKNIIGKHGEYVNTILSLLNGISKDKKNLETQALDDYKKFNLNLKDRYKIVKNKN